MTSLQPDPETVAQFPSVAADVWVAGQGDAKEATKLLTERLATLKKLKSELLKAKLRGEVSQTDYAPASADFETEI